MSEAALLATIFERLVCAEFGAAVFFGADETARWPQGALESLTAAALLNPSPPAAVIECDGCERGCFMPVHVRPAEDDRAARAFISCDKPEDLGRIRVDRTRLLRWRITGASLAGAVARLLEISLPPQANGRGWMLGLLHGREHLGAVTLAIDRAAKLSLAGKSLPLVQVLTLSADGLTADSGALVRAVEGSTQAPAAGVGSESWRKQKGKAAVDVRHDKPGGSRDKQRQIRELWASGKFSSRDRCAEEECGALGMSVSAARKALRNTPEPKRG